ncbi:hypothetical protein BWP09_07490 [Mycobacterium tuberculosis]|nr:hypothetical protein BWP09_07490 [Mycobacterium tuberculosis]
MIASAAKPGAAGHHHRTRGDRKRGEAGRSGSPPSGLAWTHDAPKARTVRRRVASEAHPAGIPCATSRRDRAALHR